MSNLYVPNFTKNDPDVKFSAIVIRSVDRLRTYNNNLETDTSSNFSIPISPNLHGNYRVGNITICNSLYNVNSNNCTIYITQSSTNYTANLPYGIYTASNLPTAVAIALNGISGISGTFSASYSTTTYKLTIVNSTTAFQMNFSASNIGCADLLGFLRQQSVTASTSLTGDLPCNLSPYQSLFINIDQCSTRYNNPLKQYNILGAIHVPLTCVSGQVQQVKYSDFPSVLTFDNVAQLNIQVRDSSGLVVSLGSEWELQLIKC